MSEEQKTANTPGPWSFNVSEGTVEAHNGSICDLNNSDYSIPQDTRNGCLIAAAPDLLEAMRGIEHFSDAVAYRTDPLAVCLRDWISVGRAAIAKAGGRS